MKYNYTKTSSIFDASFAKLCHELFEAVTESYPPEKLCTMVIDPDVEDIILLDEKDNILGKMDFFGNIHTLN